MSHSPIKAMDNNWDHGNDPTIFRMMQIRIRPDTTEKRSLERIAQLALLEGQKH